MPRRRSDISEVNPIEVKGSQGFSKIGYAQDDIKYGTWIGDPPRTTARHAYIDVGDIIENPVYLIEYLLRQKGYTESTDTAIDLTSFDACALEFQPTDTILYKIKGAISERKSLTDHITDILKTFGLGLRLGDLRKNKWQIFKLIPTTPTSVFTFTDDEVIRLDGVPQFRMRATPKDQIYNAFNFSYGNNYILNKYLDNLYCQDLDANGSIEYSTGLDSYSSVHGSTLPVFSQASQMAYGGEKLFKLDFDYVYDTTTMQRIMLDTANYNCYQKWLIELDCVHTVDTVCLEIGDIVNVDIEGLSTYIKEDRPFRILHKMQKDIYRKREYTFELIEIPNARTGLGGIINISDKDWVV
jgi:hypothetical protein